MATIMDGDCSSDIKQNISIYNFTGVPHLVNPWLLITMCLCFERWTVWLPADPLKTQI